MTTPGRESSAQIRDFSLGERDMMLMPILSRTKDPVTGLTTQVVQQGANPDGKLHTLTTDIAYVNGLPETLTYTFEGEGPTVIKTETLTRDAAGDVISSSIS